MNKQAGQRALSGLFVHFLQKMGGANLDFLCRSEYT